MLSGAKNFHFFYFFKGTDTKIFNQPYLTACHECNTNRLGIFDWLAGRE
jgi:hypothetical protein